MDDDAMNDDIPMPGTQRRVARPTARNVGRLGQALDCAAHREVAATLTGPWVPSAVADAVCGDPDLQAVVRQLFGVVLGPTLRTKWSEYLDALEASVFEVESADAWERVKVTRERFGLRLLRSCTADDLPLLRALFDRGEAAIYDEPIFVESMDAPAALVQQLEAGRNARMLKLGHFLAAPFEDDGPVLH